jgi:hypothetical protein
MGGKGMAYIHLIRVKAPQKPQRDAFRPELSSDEIIAQSFLKRPTAKVPRGTVWHIGNAAELDGSIYFRLGREAVVRAHQFDEVAREFQEIEEEQAPFTHGVYDREFQTAGILGRPGVSLNAKQVANKLQALLASTGIAEKHNAIIEVDPILDPMDMIQALRTAKRITRFEFSFGLKNPPDDHKFFQGPMKSFAAEVGADGGKASLTGPSMDPEKLIDLTRAVAAEGDEVTANLQEREGSTVVRKSLRSNYLRVEIEAQVGEVGRVISDALRQAYKRVRGSDV